MGKIGPLDSFINYPSFTYTIKGKKSTKKGEEIREKDSGINCEIL